MYIIDYQYVVCLLLNVYTVVCDIPGMNDMKSYILDINKICIFVGMPFLNYCLRKHNKAEQSL